MNFEKIYFLYDKSENVEEISKSLNDKFESVEISPFSFDFSFKENSLLFLMIDDESFKRFIISLKDSLTIVIIPYEKNPLTQKSFEIPKGAFEALELFFKEPFFSDRILLYNSKPVLDCIKIGHGEWIEQEGFLNFPKRLFPVSIETKEKKLKSASFLMEISLEAVMQRRRSYFFKESEERLCDRVCATIYSPRSVIEALKLRYFFAKKSKFSKTLPDGIGVIKSDILKISALKDEELFLSFEKESQRVKEAVFESRAIKAKIATGWKGCVRTEERKESLRVQNILFEEEEVEFYSKRRLPFVKIASENSFAELFRKLREASKGGKAYSLLLILSVLMATTGLFQNSSPTIIGAMILAPLMGPIVAFSMGALRFDGDLVARSLKTVIFSVSFAVFLSAIFTLLMPFYHINDQMALRTHPTLLDLAVAVISGIAAAYGYSDSKVGESLAGVAIAVALVPPLCVSGIGLGWGSFSMFYNAFLLFLTNFAGIVFAAGVTFYLLGYASIKYAKAAFFIKMAMVLIVAFPLYLSTRTLVKEEMIYEQISKLENISLDSKKIKLDLVGVFHKEGETFAKISVISSKELTLSERERVAKKIKRAIGEDIKVILEYGAVY